MLRKIRLTCALVVFVLITGLFLDFTGTLHTWLGWLAKIQFLPAVLALNIGVIVFLVVLTLVFGRIYWLLGGIARSLQFVRTHRTEPVSADIHLGQQPAGFLGRTCQQLCFLRKGCVAAQSAYFHHRGSKLRCTHRVGLAQRTYLLQHRLSGGYRSGIYLALLAASSRTRCREMYQMQSVRT